MTKPVKILLGVLGGVVGIVVIAVILIGLFLPTERLSAIVVQRIETATGREVSIGSTDLSLFPRVQLGLENLDFGKDAKPGAPRVRAEAIRLGVSLFPLLARRVEVREAEIVRPIVDIVLESPDSLGQHGAGGPGSGPGDGKAPSGLTIDVRSLTVTDGSVSVHLADGTPMLELKGFAEKLRARASANGDIELDGVSSLEDLALHAPGGTFGRGLSLRLEKTLRFDAGQDALEIQKASLDFAGVPVTLTGRVDGIRSKEMRSDLHLSGGPSSIDRIVALIPAQLFPAVDGMTSQGTLEIDGAIRGSLTAREGPDFRIAVHLRDGRIQYPGVERPIEDIRLDLTATPDSVEITEFTARAVSNRLRAHAAVADYKTAPRIRAAIDADVNLDELPLFYPSADTFGLGGRARAALIAEGEAAKPDAFAVNGTMHAEGVRMKTPSMRVAVTDATGDLLFDQRQVTLSNLTARLGSSDLSMNGRLTNVMALQPGRTDAGRASGTFDVRSRRLDLDELMPPPAAGAGAGAGAGGATSTGGTPAPIAIPELPPLDATISLSADEMKVDGVETRQVRGEGRLQENVLNLQRLALQVFGGNMLLQGSLDLRDRAAPRFDLATDVQGAEIRQLFAHAQGLKRFTIIGSNLTGSLNSHAELQGALSEALTLDLPSLASQGQVEIKGAALAEHPIQEQLSTFLDAPALKKTIIEELLQPFRIENGMLKFEGMTLTASDYQAIGNGSCSLDGRYEVTLDLLLPPSMAKGIRSQVPAEIAAILFGEAQDRILVPVKIAGIRSEMPTIGLDRDRLGENARAAVTARIETQKRKLEDEAKKRAAEALSGMLGAKSDTTKAPGTANEPAKKELEGKVKDALQNIFGGKKK